MVNAAASLAQCFLRLAHLPSFPLDRLSRYEATLWGQATRTIFLTNPYTASHGNGEADCVHMTERNGLLNWRRTYEGWTSMKRSGKLRHKLRLAFLLGGAIYTAGGHQMRRSQAGLQVP